MGLFIQLNSSEKLAFFGSFGLIFSLPNFESIFIQDIFPGIIANSGNFARFFEFIYFLLVFAVFIESVSWIVDLVRNIDKTRYLNVDFDYYVLKIVVFIILGIFAGALLNKILF
jgi:hypothetical protein